MATSVVAARLATSALERRPGVARAPAEAPAATVVNVGSLQVTNSGTILTLTNWEARVMATGAVTIAAGANVTHAGCYRYPDDMSNRVHIVAQDLTVDGTIDTDGRGFFRGRHANFGPDVHGQGPGLIEAHTNRVWSFMHCSSHGMKITLGNDSSVIDHEYLPGQGFDLVKDVT